MPSKLSHLILLAALLLTAFPHSAFAVFDADLGRWISRDPAGYFDGPNSYCYVSNNPAGSSDPSGLAPMVGLLNFVRLVRAFEDGAPVSCNVQVLPGTNAVCAPKCAETLEQLPGQVPLGVSFCDPNGNKVSCNCWQWYVATNPNNIPNWPNQLTGGALALSNCINQCEGCHQQNYTCNPPSPYPVWPTVPVTVPGGGTIHANVCSECNVAACISNCINGFTCPGGEAGQACEDMKDALQQTADFWCAKCIVQLMDI